MSNPKNYKFETLQLHVGQENPDPVTDSRSVPIYQMSSYVFKDSAQAAGRFALTEGGNIYTRLMNPTSDVFEKRIAARCGARHGVGRCRRNIRHTKHRIVGDHIVSDNAIYGGTYNLFAHTFEDYGISTTFVDGGNPENFENAILPNTKAIFIESLGNPNSTIVDIEAVAKIAHKNGIPPVRPGGTGRGTPPAAQGRKNGFSRSILLADSSRSVFKFSRTVCNAASCRL